MKHYDEIDSPVYHRDDCYFGSEGENALQDAYFMLLDRGYDEGDLAPLREIIFTETVFGPRALDR